MRALLARWRNDATFRDNLACYGGPLLAIAALMVLR